MGSLLQQMMCGGTALESLCLDLCCALQRFARGVSVQQTQAEDDGAKSLFCKVHTLASDMQPAEVHERMRPLCGTRSKGWVTRQHHPQHRSHLECPVDLINS